MKLYKTDLIKDEKYINPNTGTTFVFERLTKPSEFKNIYIVDNKGVFHISDYALKLD